MFPKYNITKERDAFNKLSDLFVRVLLLGSIKRRWRTGVCGFQPLSADMDTSELRVFALAETFKAPKCHGISRVSYISSYIIWNM